MVFCFCFGPAPLFFWPERGEAPFSFATEAPPSRARRAPQGFTLDGKRGSGIIWARSPRGQKAVVSIESAPRRGAVLRASGAGVAVGAVRGVMDAPRNIPYRREHNVTSGRARKACGPGGGGRGGGGRGPGGGGGRGGGGLSSAVPSSLRDGGHTEKGFRAGAGAGEKTSTGKKSLRGLYRAWPDRAAHLVQGGGQAVSYKVRYVFAGYRFFITLSRAAPARPPRNITPPYKSGGGWKRQGAPGGKTERYDSPPAGWAGRNPRPWGNVVRDDLRPWSGGGFSFPRYYRNISYNSGLKTALICD